MRSKCREPGRCRDLAMLFIEIFRWNSVRMRPPNVPIDFNSVGLYKRTFEIPENWDGKQIHLHFDGVKIAFWIWINGEYVGFNKGAMTPDEFDITEYLEEETNTISVKVIRWADSTYLENQDMWKFHGIYRSVYLFSVPNTHIRDFYVRTDFDGPFEDATLSVDVDIINSGNEDVGDLEIVGELYDSHNQLVASYSCAALHNLNSIPKHPPGFFDATNQYSNLVSVGDQSMCHRPAQHTGRSQNQDMLLHDWILSTCKIEKMKNLYPGQVFVNELN